MTSDIIDRLIAAHGEGGLSPSRADWEVILATVGPVHILNLICFEAKVPGFSSGLAAYDAYRREVGTAFARAGGKAVLLGEPKACFGIETETDWDWAILSTYPTGQALARMWLDPDFLKAHDNREIGVKRALVMVFPTGM